MKKSIFQNYKVFCGPKYRILMWGLYPMLLLLASVLIGNYIGKEPQFRESPFLAIMLGFAPGGFMIAWETLVDFAFLRGVGRKRVYGLHYAYSSIRGFQMYKDAVRFDLYRKLILLFLVNVIVTIRGFDPISMDPPMAAEIFAIEYIFLIVSTALSQLFEFFASNMIFGVFGMYGAGILIGLIYSFQLDSNFLRFCTWLAALLLHRFYIAVLIRKGRNSYYDEY